MPADVAASSSAVEATCQVAQGSAMLKPAPPPTISLHTQLRMLRRMLIIRNKPPSNADTSGKWLNVRMGAS